MAERPEPRKRPSATSWDARQYSFGPDGEEADPRAGEPDAADPPPSENAGRHRGPEEVPAESDSRRADERIEAPAAARPPAQGLYDLPGLLARIWSVPATRLSTSGSYSTRAAPAIPVTRPVEHDLESPDRREPVPPAPSSLLYLPHGKGPSLPLAAVPSLALAPPEPVPEGPTAPARLARPLELTPVTAMHYIAWRYPPCRLAYALGRGRVAPAEVRPSRVSVEVGRYSGSSESLRIEREPLIRPATLPWVSWRQRMLLPAEA
jgi:hypothetical protein